MPGMAYVAHTGELLIRGRDEGKRQSRWQVTERLESMGPELRVALRYVKYCRSRDNVDVVREQAMGALRRSARINIPPGHERDEGSSLRIISDFCGHASTMLHRPTVPEPERVDRRAHGNGPCRRLGRESDIHG